MIEIPFSELSAIALAGVIDAFILREGTDYGHQDIDMDTKRARVRRQLENGQAAIYFYPENEHIDIQLTS